MRTGGQRLLAPLLLLACASPPPPAAGFRPGQRLSCRALYAEGVESLTASCAGDIRAVVLIGVSPPEGPGSRDRAANYARSLLPEGTALELELGRVPAGRRGRLRAYVHLPSGALLNALLLEEGYAVPAEDGETKHAAFFESLYSEARKYRKGLWRGR